MTKREVHSYVFSHGMSTFELFTRAYEWKNGKKGDVTHDWHMFRFRDIVPTYAEEYINDLEKKA